MKNTHFIRSPDALAALSPERYRVTQATVTPVPFLRTVRRPRVACAPASTQRRCASFISVISRPKATVSTGGCSITKERLEP